MFSKKLQVYFKKIISMENSMYFQSLFQQRDTLMLYQSGTSSVAKK